MHVALMVGRLGVGGAERQFTELARGLAGRGHRVTFYTILSGGGLALQLEAVPGVTLVPLLERERKAGATGLLRALRRLRRRLRADRPDVLYSALYLANLMNALAVPASGVVAVWGVRTADAQLVWKERAPMWIARWMRRRASGMICNSHAGLELNRRWDYGPADAVVIWNGIAADRFRPDEEVRREFRDAHSLPSDAVVAGLVGRISPLKGHACFIEAAERARALDERLHFVGVVPTLSGLDTTLAARAAALGDRFFWVEGGTEPERIFPGLDILCSASRVEGFANVIGEGMAAGLPVVATDVGDSARIVGDAGKIVPYGDVDGMARCMATLASDATWRRELGLRARRRALSRFGMEPFVRRTEAYLERIVAAA